MTTPDPFTPKLTPHPSVFPGEFGLRAASEPSRFGLGVGRHPGAAWVMGDRASLDVLHIDGIYFAAPPTKRHIRAEAGRVTIEDVTVFPGSLTHRQAFMWAIRPLLGLPHRIRYRLGHRAWRLIYAAQDRFRGIRTHLKKEI